MTIICFSFINVIMSHQKMYLEENGLCVCVIFVQTAFFIQGQRLKKLESKKIREAKEEVRHHAKLQCLKDFIKCSSSNNVNKQMIEKYTNLAFLFSNYLVDLNLIAFFMFLFLLKTFLVLFIVNACPHIHCHPVHLSHLNKVVLIELCFINLCSRDDSDV